MARISILMSKEQEGDFTSQYSLAVEKRVEGRARSWGWWMAPKRLGPGGLLRNSGFRPKSSLCGSDCICFWNGKQDLEETVWKGNSKRHFQNDVRRAAHSYWCFNKTVGFWDPEHSCTAVFLEGRSKAKREKLRLLHISCKFHQCFHICSHPPLQGVQHRTAFNNKHENLWGGLKTLAEL